MVSRGWKGKKKGGQKEMREDVKRRKGKKGEVERSEKKKRKKKRQEEEKTRPGSKRVNLKADLSIWEKNREDEREMNKVI